MAYVTVPKDLAQVKTKLLFNLTKRQIVCFGSGALVGLPLFFLVRKALPPSLALLLMILVMLPFFLLAVYERNGEPLEKTARHYIESRIVRPRVRPYRTRNLYAAVTRQIQYDQEVRRIVHKQEKRP